MLTSFLHKAPCRIIGLACLIFLLTPVNPEKQKNDALVAAIQKADLPAVKKALAAKAEVNTADYDGLTPLMWAARCHDPEILKLLLHAKADVHARDKAEETALIKSWYPENTKLLLAAGADVNAKTRKGLTALIVAAGYTIPTELIKELIRDNPSHNNLTGEIEFIKLRLENSKEIVKLLISAKANLEAEDDHGSTALSQAAGYMVSIFSDTYPLSRRQETDPSGIKELLGKYHFELVKLLIEAKADVNAHSGLALMAAAGSGDPKIVKLLLSANADAKAKNSEGNTALLFTSHPETMKLLIVAGADINANVRGRTALMNAAEYGYMDLVEPLIAAGANLDAKEHMGGMTALMIAVGHRRAGIVQVLINAKANVYIKDREGETALQMALESNNKEIIALLKAATRKK